VRPGTGRPVAVARALEIRPGARRPAPERGDRPLAENRFPGSGSAHPISRSGPASTRLGSRENSANSSGRPRARAAARTGRPRM
jgi:hypothetical protein